MIRFILLATIYYRYSFVYTEPVDEYVAKITSVASKSARNTPFGLRYQVCAEVGSTVYYCPGDEICCTPGSPTSKCCPAEKPLCVDNNKYCCPTGYPKVCGELCCKEESVCCEKGGCCKSKDSCCENQCCVEGSSCCSGGERKTCCDNNKQACCDGGYGCVEPCVSPFDAVGCLPANSLSVLEGMRQEKLQVIFDDLSLIEKITGNWEKLYRVIRADEDPSKGLVAKDPSAKKEVISHVNCGSRNNYKSQFISTTASLDVAKRYKRPGLRIVEIDVSKIPTGTAIIDLTIESVRDYYLGKAVCSSYARASQEVLLSGSHPIPCVVIEESRKA